MTLAQKLSTYDEKYWDFSEYRNDSPLVRYPAVMVAPMQACRGRRYRLNYRERTRPVGAFIMPILTCLLE